MDFLPFDKACYDNLFERFQYIFEPELINDICKSGQMKNYKEDNILIDIGDKITHMPLVLEGTIKIMTEDEEENELLLYYLEFGDTCAITISCCTKKTKSTIRAITESPTEILLVPVDKMEEWMIKYKSWRTYILDSYNSRLNEMLSAIDNIVFNSMEDRLKKYLRDKAWMAKSDKIYISHADIANDMHSSRVVISRLMKKIETQGIIKQHRNMVEYLEFQTPNI